MSTPPKAPCPRPTTNNRCSEQPHLPRVALGIDESCAGGFGNMERRGVEPDTDPVEAETFHGGGEPLTRGFQDVASAGIGRELGSIATSRSKI